jgi:hypothetical protein
VLIWSGISRAKNVLEPHEHRVSPFCRKCVKT